MLDQLQEINAIQGVAGSFVYMKGVGLASTKLPTILQEKTLPYLNRYIARTMQINAAAELSPIEAEIRLENATVYCKFLDSTSALVIIGEGKLNIALVNVTTDLLLDELKVEVAKTRQKRLAEAQAKSSEAATAPETSEKPSQPISLNEAMNDPAIGPVFSAMKTLLAKAVGPVAEMVLNDSTKSWSKAGPVSVDRLHELVDVLCMEIGDQSLEADFRKKLKPLIIQAMPSTESEPAEAPSEEKPSGTSGQHTQETALLTKTIAEIEKAFARIVGPVGEMLMREAYAQWKKSAEPSMDRLPELIDLLCQEIGDDAMEKEFRQAIQPILA